MTDNPESELKPLTPNENTLQVKRSVRQIVARIVKEGDDTREEAKGKAIAQPSPKDLVTMRKRIEAYFKECDDTKVDVATQYGKETGQKQDTPYTIAGMTLALGMSSRDELRRYRKTQGFIEILGWAMLKIEEQRNNQLLTRHGNVAGIIFDMKNNFKWRDTPDTKRIGIEVTLSEALEEISGESRGLPTEKMTELRPHEERNEHKLHIKPSSRKANADRKAVK